MIKKMGKVLLSLTVMMVFANIGFSDTNNNKPCKISFCAWDAYLLFDDNVQVIIVPEIGRLMSYKRNGGKNIFRVREEYKKQLPSSGKIQLFGGLYTWLAPQSKWIDKNGKNKIFPFDFSLDIGPYTVTYANKRSLTMISPISKIYSVQLEKSFVLNSDSSLTYTVTLHNRGNREIRWAIWNIVAVEPKGKVIFKASKGDIKFHDNFKRDSEIFLPLLKVAEGVSTLDLSKFKSEGSKLYVKPCGNYLKWQQGNTVLIRKFQVDKSAEFIDHGTQIEIWADRKYKNYELEVFSPYYTIKAGKNVSWKETLYLLGKYSP